MVPWGGTPFLEQSRLILQPVPGGEAAARPKLTRSARMVSGCMLGCFDEGISCVRVGDFWTLGRKERARFELIGNMVSDGCNRVVLLKS
jgi:hypothetical protein